MKRQLFLALSAASLVLCVATAIVWLETLHDSDGFTVGSNQQYYLSSYRGWLYIQRIVVEVAYPANLPNTPSARLAIYVTHTTPRHALAPLWLVFMLTAILPTFRLIEAKRRRDFARIRAGLCSKCGYDLRATPDRCPECGAIPGNKLKPLPK